ncbi:cyclo(L-tyrosyl-L-tyrosyl) synthase [Kibdelosporangium banguiense]|uniref:Cyclodipeptide synthase n=1 Tax=Kibdelosporangium banguiense TaxID=1365924 RepID=A0ABS4TER6_9PSEU|nr:tRNA-dependent cyclodipeptide synthase [Kibdelosporangium banguiense]MBP2322900.1 cyclo(L-tyrosyl-L-tyrosyl) synthase [Kibdelosporangium banguiense]
MCEAVAASPNCQRLLAGGRHMLFGVSLFNSFFSQARLLELAAWALVRFDSVHFLIADTPSIHTLAAVGYSPQRAAVKVEQEARRVRSRVHRALADVGAGDPDGMLLGWSDLERNPGYLKLRDLVRTAFDDDERFRASCLAVSRAYLRHRGETPTEQQVITASAYFLNELPIGMDTPSILGVPESLCAYHRVLAFADVLQTGPGWLAPSANQGYLMVRTNG